jgi:hypothetical protein
VACWHVADFDRTVHVYRAGTCHAGMTNGEKVPLARRIRFFLCFRGFTYGIQVFPVSKCFFLLMPLQAEELLGLRFRAPNGVTSRAPATGKFLREWVGLTGGTCDACQLLIGRHRFEAYSACHVEKIDTLYHLIGPLGIICHVSSAHWSVQFKDVCRSGHVAATWQILIR